MNAATGLTGPGSHREILDGFVFHSARRALLTGGEVFGDNDDFFAVPLRLVFEQGSQPGPGGLGNAFGELFILEQV